MTRLFLFIALLMPLGALAAGKDKAPPKPAPGVNWEGQVLKATGAGAPDVRASTAAQARLGAETAAKMDAFRNLLSQAKGITVSSSKTLGDVMTTNEDVKGKVEGVIRGYKITGKRYFSDQGVEVDVEVPLAAIASALPEESGAPATAVNTSGDAANTGLVIDARGLKVTPALSPRVLDESGKSLYGIDCLSQEARKSKGAASYFQSLEGAKAKLVGEKPLVLKASKVNGTDLVVSADDAKKLAGTNTSYLAEGRVAIITN